MTYIDGYLVPVPSRNKGAYEELATQAAAVFKDYGATRVSVLGTRPRRQGHGLQNGGQGHVGRDGRLLMVRVALEREA